MTEKEWVKTLINRIEASLREIDNSLRVTEGERIPYSNEILSYSDKGPEKQNYIRYETDILIYQKLKDDEWKPRVIIETKINSITTHDAITYSQKAQTHKNVHPYLRYGILIGNRKHYPLPGRLFRHGEHFDFMLSWKGFESTEEEWERLINLLMSEYEASKMLDEIIYNSRSKDRSKFTFLHRPLKLKK